MTEKVQMVDIPALPLLVLGIIVEFQNYIPEMQIISRSSHVG